MSKRSLLCVALLLAWLLSPGAIWAMKPDDAGFAQFRGASFPVTEETEEVTIVVKRQRGNTGAVTVDYATTAGSAEAGVDYEETNGTLSWDDGDRGDKSFTVVILDDDLDEGLETFGIELSNPTGDLEIGAVSRTVVRIRPSDRSGDDDPDDPDDPDEPGSVIKLTAIAFPAFESSGEAIFEVERQGTAGDVTVDFSTMDGSAIAGDDYVTTAGTLTWADGEKGIQTVAVPLVDDTEPEDLETISILLTNATGDATLGVRDVASIVIVDDDGGGDGACVPDGQTLCLLDGRFQIVGSWEDKKGNTGPFNVIPASDGSGLVWFFDDSNIELLIKVLNGCPVNGHFWVFFSATTNLGFTMEVTDLDTGEINTYENPIGNIPMAVTDTKAFDSCP